jgi:hypothetical protein
MSEIGPNNLKNASPAPDFRPGDAFQRLWKGFLEVFWLFLNAQKWIKSIYKLRKQLLFFATLFSTASFPLTAPAQKIGTSRQTQAG